MGRLAIIDLSVQHALENFTKAWSIGLLIGNITESKDYIIHYAKCPLEEDDKQKSISTLPDTLMTSHAGELQRMLPGGICICGVAVVATSTELSSAQVKLQQLMLATYKKLMTVDNFGQNTKTWHLLQYDNVTKKVTGKSLDVDDYKNSLKPSEVRFQQLKSGWLIVNSNLHIEKQFYINRNQQDDHFEHQIMSGLEPVMESITNSLSVINGRCLEDDTVVGELVKAKRQNSHEAESYNVDVQLFTRSRTESYSSCAEMVSTIYIKGTVSGLSFLKSPTTASQITESIKSDLKKSIKIRCQLLCEDILQVGSEKHTQIGEKMIYETPPRVYIPHSATPVLFIDYMFKDEKKEECAERAKQLLGYDHVVANALNMDMERSATVDDLKLMEIMQSKPEEQISVVDKPHSIAGSLSQRVAIAAGAALTLAVSLAYLNMTEWFGQ